MSENGKGSKVAGDFRTPQWEKSKLWYQNDVAKIGQINIKSRQSVAGKIKMKPQEQDRIECSCGEHSFKLDHEGIVICSSCDAVIDVTGWDTIMTITDDKGITFNGDPEKNYDEYKKMQVKK